MEKGAKSPSRKKYYILTKKQSTLCLILFLIVILVIIVFLAAYFGTREEWERGNQRPTTLATWTTGKSTSEAATTTISSNTPYSQIRLPKHVVPESYRIHLSVSMIDNYVEGNSTIKIKSSNPSKYMIIHAYGYSSIDGKIKNINTREYVQPTKQFVYTTNQYHVMVFKDDLPPGEYELEYSFGYSLRTDLKGFYQSSYKTLDGTDKYVAATQFEPVDARAAFPCFDEPAMKATFHIKMSFPKNFIAISNMPVIRQTTMNDVTTNEFDISPKMPTYLVAFVVCEFASKTVVANTTRKVNMTFYAPKEQIDQIDHAMTVGSKILPFFEKYYNVTYPLEKADMIAIPDFAAGAMENWGLVTYRASALLYDRLQSGLSNKDYVTSVVSHELAHQWFGNIVTMEWWSDLWLNEGFASYVEYLGQSEVENWNVLDFQVVTDVAQALALDALVSSHPVYVEVTHPDKISEIFDAISYQKGCSILRMLDDLLGPNVFKKGLNTYLTKHSYGNAKTNDLWESLSEASQKYGDGKNVSHIMNTWILQMGFPVVNVNKMNGSFSLSQSRFLRDPNPDLSKTNYISPYNYTWIIPFNYMVLNISDLKNIRVLTEKDIKWMEFGGALIQPNGTASDLLVKGNAGQYGFFRVNYDANGWRNIIKVLNANHTILNVKDRAGLIGDAFELANSGRLDYTVALDLFNYIGNDTDYLPWKAGVDSISFLSTILTTSKPSLKLYSKFLLKKVTPLFEKFGFKNNSNTLERYLQVLVARQACGNGHPECLKKAKEMFQKFMNDPEADPVPPDFRSLVYYYGVFYGGVKEWDFLFKRYQNNKIASETTKLMYGMSATQEPWILDRWLNMGLNASIVKSQDVSYVFSYVATANPIGRYAAWNFMNSNWKVISDRFSKSFFTIRRIISSVIAGFTTKYELAKANTFIKEKIKNESGTATNIIKQSVEKIAANIEWLNNNEELIEKWLTQNV